MSVSSGLPEWLARLLRRRAATPMPPGLLDGYARQVMARLASPVRQARPAWWRWLAVPVAAAAGVWIWALAALHPAGSRPSAQETLARVTVLDGLGEAVPSVSDTGTEPDLMEDAQEVDGFVLAEAPPEPTADTLLPLLQALDADASLDLEWEVAPDGWLEDAADELEAV